MLEWRKTIVLLLAIIAINLCAITIKLYTFSIPTIGDYRALQDTHDLFERNAQRKELNNSVPIVHIEGTNVQ